VEEQVKIARGQVQTVWRMPWKIPTWIAWAAGVCAQRRGVAWCHATTQHLKSVGHAVCFESPFLIVLMSHSTIPMWLLLLDSWMPPVKHLFWPQKSVAISFLPWNMCLNFFGFGKPPCSHTVDCFFISPLLWEIWVLSPLECDPEISPLHCFTVEGTLKLMSRAAFLFLC